MEKPEKEVTSGHSMTIVNDDFSVELLNWLAFPHMSAPAFSLAMNRGNLFPWWPLYPYPQ